MAEVTNLRFDEDGDVLTLVVNVDKGPDQIIGHVKPQGLYLLAQILPTYATRYATKKTVHPPGADVEATAGVIPATGFELNHSLVDDTLVLGIRSALGVLVQWKIQRQAALAVGRELVKRAKNPRATPRPKRLS